MDFITLQAQQLILSAVLGAAKEPTPCGVAVHY